MPSNWSHSGLKWFEIWSRRVKRLTLAGPSGARLVPPLPKDPLKAHSLENSHTNKHADIHKDTHIHIHRHTRIDKRTHRGRKTKLRSREQNESSILELEFQVPRKVFTTLMFLCLVRFRVQQHPGN